MTTDMREFRIFECPLDGSHLIEASAGTGKTHTITNLFVRLVIEKRLPVESILVVTFTEAATAELRDRIRARLRKAREVLDGTSDAGEDTFLEALPERLTGTARNEAVQRLRVAVHDFDRVSIFTIHGFCLRALQENAFESGSLFDSELVTDQRAFRREAAEDFWRLRFSDASPLFVNWAVDAGTTGPESLLDLAGKLVLDPRLEIIPEAPDLDTSTEESAFLAALDAVRDAWPGARSEVERLLHHPGFNRRKVPEGKIPGWMESFDALRHLGRDDCALFDDLGKFTQEAIDGAMKKGQAPPQHPFFGLCANLLAARDALDTAFEARLLALRAEFLAYFTREVDEKKERQKVLFFDDLLLRLHRAIEGPGGAALATSMRATYQAALIDEFQDTDTVQYAIFNTLFNRDGGTLFLIGDPKQAIYGFRGADIFAYMEASREVPSRFTLKENWRSEPELIRGVNAVFGGARMPFVYEEIPFAPVEAAGGKHHEELTLDGTAEPPFRVWRLEPASGEARFIAKGEARHRITRAVAAEVARLVALGRHGRLRLGVRPVKEGDLAVLVRKNDEARRIQAAFSDLGVHSVVTSTENLFDSHEALELERLLAAIVNPADSGALRAALATDLMGIRGAGLAGLAVDEDAWDAWLVRFADWHEEWEGRGFFRMFRKLVTDRRVLPRLMAFPDGERRCTNVLHLAEVLHQAALEKNLGMAALLQWLAAQRDERTLRSDEDQLRLESDENAVRIVTIHKSKGLEYPVVFCPFAWDGLRRDGGGPVLFHDEAKGRRLTLDLGSETRGTSLTYADKEQYAENLRLLYVALTRARSRCTLAWGLLNGAETSAPAYLLHQPEDAPEETLREETAARYKGLDSGSFRADLDALAARHAGAVAVEPLPGGRADSLAPNASDEAALEARIFRGSIDRSWRVTSYSALALNRAKGDDGADRDEATAWSAGTVEASPAAGEAAGADARSIFSFPAGAAAGTFLHEVFETLDFQAFERGEPLEGTLGEALSAHGFDADWAPVVAGMVRNVLTTPLDPEQPDLRLADIPQTDRMPELEFIFPLKRVTPRALDRVLAAWAAGSGASAEETGTRPDRFQFDPVRGFMKGFIDLVFRFDGRYYLLDWKSNHLGNTPEAYSGPNLDRAMEEHLYTLQCALYISALDRYLRTRLPDYRYEDHFGGAYYLFLRGIAPETGPAFGIHRTRPPVEAVQTLADTLIDAG